MLDRRTFLTGLLAAPAIVRAGSLDFVPRGAVLMPAAPMLKPIGYHIWFQDFPLTSNGEFWFDAEADAIERMHRA